MSSWQDVYRRLDPMEPLKRRDDRLEEGLYADDFYAAVRDKLLLDATGRYKLLLSGHVGCGKSTLLNLLASDEDLTDRFHLVKFSIQRGDSDGEDRRQELLDPNDMDHIDLLLALVTRAVTSVDESQFESLEPLATEAKELADRLHGLITDQSSELRLHQDRVDAEVGAGLSVFEFLKARLFFHYRYEEERRQAVRQYCKTHITELLDSIDRLLTELSAGLGKDLLILVDDTDKMPPELSRKTFLENGHHLARPQANILFMVDLSLATHPRFRTVQDKFSAELFPALKLQEKDGGQSSGSRANRDTLGRVLDHRVPRALIADPARSAAIELSGGVVRELIRLLQYAVFHAKSTIEPRHIDQARNRMANQFALYAQHTHILRSVLNDPDWVAKGLDHEKDEAILLELLAMPALFEYRNGDFKWHRPFPVLIDYLRQLDDHAEEGLDGADGDDRT